jgi:hypothetical protein
MKYIAKSAGNGRMTCKSSTSLASDILNIYILKLFGIRLKKKARYPRFRCPILTVLPRTTLVALGLTRVQNTYSVHRPSQAR